MSSSGPPRIPSLDGLRALSIGLVVGCHLVQTNGSPVPYGPFRDRLVNLGPLGVRVFFVISGYLITHLLLTELARSHGIHLARFYFRRTVRIFTPYYVLILAAVLMERAGWLTLTAGDVGHAVTYTMNYFPARSWGLGHTWSLAVEEQFYLLWPAGLLLLGRKRGLTLAAILLAVCPLIRLAYFYLAPSLIEEEIGYRFETVVDALAIGALLAGARHVLAAHPVWQRTIASRFFVAVPITVLLVSLTDQRLLSNLVAGVTVQNVGIAACIAWVLARPSGRIGTLLNHPMLVGIGMMSYSIYLWQQIFLNPTSSAWVARFPMNLVLTGVAALGSYYLVERPSLDLRKRLETRWLGYRAALGG